MKFNKKQIVPLLFSITLVGSASIADEDILTHYRNQGMRNLAHILDKKLTKKEYWEQYLQNVDTTFGYIENHPYLLVCDKSESKLTLYTKVNGQYEAQKEYGAFTGKMKGDKQEAGDLKTPIGIYNLTQKLNKVDSFYGPLAFVTSYPNLYDQYKKKTGKGIWLHGLPLHQDRDKFTKGCIAINNQNLTSLSKQIDINKTLLIINEKDIKTAHKEKLSSILAQLYKWRYAWIYNDLETYLDFYDTNFIRFDGMKKEQFSNYKKRIFSKKEKKKILFTNINVLPYPNEEETYKITFKEQYRAPSYAFTGNKTLIVKLVNNQVKIISEQ